MPARITLEGPGWATHGHTSARGQAFDAEGRLLRATALARRFDALADDASWLAEAARLNGCFALVGAGAGAVRAAVDRIRSIPLFFGSDGDTFAISDHAQSVRDALPNARVDALSRDEFALTGYVTGASTLIEGLEQLRAGHCLIGRAGAGGTLQQRRYYEFRHGSFFTESKETMQDRLAHVHERVFRRLLEDIGDRPIVLPLSGGYDSRLIAVMLHELGRRDVFCYCYGAPGNWESSISRDVAAHLGYRWMMIPYTAERWRECASTEAFQRYFRDAGNLASIPHVQEWPAVQNLERQGELPEGAVFIPGHTGDFLTGNHIPKWYPQRTRITRAQTLQAIVDTHYSLWDWPSEAAATLRRAIEARIEAIAGSIGDCTPEAAADLYECWEWQERQAKFIVNSVRVYEAFGCEWRLPLWDAELMDFWSQVPLEARVGRSLFLDFVARHHALPVTDANTDYAWPMAAVIGIINRSGARPLAKRAQRSLRRIKWREQYEHDPMAWFALVDPERFRRRYTGREIGHSFFALDYLDQVLGAAGHQRAPQRAIPR